MLMLFKKDMHLLITLYEKNKIKKKNFQIEALSRIRARLTQQVLRLRL